MANTLNGKLDLQFQPKITGNVGAVAPLIRYLLTLTQGTALGQIDLAHYKERTVTTGTPDDIDLIGGGLVDPLGQPFNPVKVVGMAYVNDSTTAAQIITVGGTGSTFASWLTGTNPGVLLGPGGCLIVINPSLAAYAVTTSSADVQRVTVASGTGVPYRVGYMARSA